MLKTWCAGVFRRMLVVHAAICGILAAVSCTSSSCVGAPVTPEIDQSIRLTGFSVSPASQVNPGDSLLLKATTSEPTTDCMIQFELDGMLTGTYLWDDGIPPDQFAGDGIWSAEWTVYDGGGKNHLNTVAVLYFNDGSSQTKKSGPQIHLTIGEGN